MICRRAGAGVDGGGKETTTKGAEKKRQWDEETWVTTAVERRLWQR